MNGPSYHGSEVGRLDFALVIWNLHLASTDSEKCDIVAGVLVEPQLVLLRLELGGRGITAVSIYYLGTRDQLLMI